MRSIYRQLASALHPDREPDPVERERKSALMSQANAAYERGDLTALLQLQLQAEQVDEAHIAQMADDKLAALSLLLKDQVKTLEGELGDAEMRLSVELGIPVGARMKEALLTRLLQEEQEELAHVVSQMQDDLVRVRDDAQLKLWLREQAALAREQEREEAFWRAWAAGFLTRPPRSRGGSHGPDHAVVVQDGVQRQVELFGLELVQIAVGKSPAPR